MIGFVFNMLRMRHVSRKNYLHGVDLDAWNLVGHTTISYEMGDGISLDGTVFGFCSKEDPDDRFFKIISHGKNKFFDDHGWIVEHASLWEIGELPLWEIARSRPSLWLCERMREDKGLTWDENSSWWISFDQTVSPDHSEDRVGSKSGNVVVVDFTNKVR